MRLQGQLASVDQGAADPARAEQIKRSDDAIAKQQADLDRAVAQAHKAGCAGEGFFALFSALSPQCGPITSSIQQMRGNLDRMMSEQQQLKTGTDAQDGQRRALIGALAQNNCGAQYASAASSSGPTGFFDALFGNGTVVNPNGDGAPSGTFPYRLCADLRRILFPDLVFDGVDALRRRRENVPAAVPGE